MTTADRRSLLGVPVDLVDIDRAVARCLAAVDGPNPLRVLTLNPEMVMRARRDPALASCFAGRTLIVPDGIGIVLAGRFRGFGRLPRVPGIDLCHRLAAEAARRAWPVFLYGGEPGVAARAGAALAMLYPGLILGGVEHGFLAPLELAGLPGRIAESGARLILVGLGVPRQELWLRDHLPATGADVGIGVGGSFDVLSGRIPRAPAALRRLGLEWVYRVWREPRRWRRLLVLPGFLWHAVRPGADREGRRCE